MRKPDVATQLEAQNLSLYISKAKLSTIRSRYYNTLRHERQLFCVKTDEVEIWNRKKMTVDETSILEQDQI
jgi:hypothetical protein